MPTSSPGRFFPGIPLCFFRISYVSFGFEIAKLKRHTLKQCTTKTCAGLSIEFILGILPSKEKIAAEIVKCIEIKYIQESFKNMRSHM